MAAQALFSILCLVLNREAAENIGRIDKAVSPPTSSLISGQGSARKLRVPPKSWGWELNPYITALQAVA